MLDRRGFLKFVGGAGAGLLATPLVWKSTDDVSIWTQNWPWVPDPAKGEPSYVSTISKLCPSGQGIRIRMLGNRPVTVHGDPDHPLSRGSVNALAASEVQLLHSPARLRSPHKRGADGKYVPITWEEANTILTQGLKQAKDKGGIYAVSGDPTSAINDVLSAIANNGGGTCFIMPGEEQPAHLAWKLVGKQGRLGYDIEHSDMVLAIGAGVLESWGPVVRNREAWSSRRPTGHAPEMRFAYASAVQDNTAAGADWWLPMQAGQELLVALGVMHLLNKAGRGEGMGDALAGYSPKDIEKLTGIPAARLEDVASSLLAAKRPLVIVGSPINQGGGAAPIMAGIACNLMLGGLYREGGIDVLPYLPAVIQGASALDELLENDLMAYTLELGKGKAAPGAVIFHEANPAYALPGGGTPLFEKAGFTVAFTCFMDETAEKCDLILPSAMGLERYDDCETPYGVGSVMYSLATPVAAPLYDAQPAGDVLLEAGRTLGLVSGFSDMVSVLRARARAAGANWNQLSNGKAHVGSQRILPGTSTSLSVNFHLDILTEAAKSLPKKGDGVGLAPVVRHGVGTPSTGIPPYAVKLVTRRETVKRLTMLHMNSATASELGVGEGSRVLVSGAGVEFPARVLVDEGLSTGTVSMLYGMGHTAFDAFSQNKGSNLLQLATPAVEAGTGLTIWSTITVKVAKV